MYGSRTSETIARRSVVPKKSLDPLPSTEPPREQGRTDAIPDVPGRRAHTDAFRLGRGLIFILAATALLVALVRQGLERARYTGWNRDIASLVHDDGGRTNRHR